MTTLSPARPRGCAPLPAAPVTPANPPRRGTLRAVEQGAVRESLVSLVTSAQRAIDADRATLLLLDADGAAAPVVSAGRGADEAVWSHVRPLPLVPLDAVVAALDGLSERVAVGVDDAACCGWLPERLREAYRIGSFGIAALTARGRTLGALVVYGHGPRPHTGTELGTLAALASAAAGTVDVALEVAAEAHAVEARDALIANAVLLHRSPDVESTLRCALAAAAEMTRGAGLYAGLLAPTGEVTLLHHHAPDPGERRRRLADLGPVATVVESAVRTQVGAPVVLAADALVPWTGCHLGPFTDIVVAPLGDVGGARAFAVIGCHAGAGTDPATLAVLSRLRDHVAAASARAQQAAAAERRVQHLQVLYQLADDVALAPDIRLVVERLAPAVRSAARAELIDVFLCDPAASRLFGTAVARGSLARLMANWRRRPRARVVEDGGLLVIPMLLDGALVGVVRVRPLDGHELEDAERHLLQTIADGLGEMVSRTVLRDKLAASDRELAVADERERIARDLHDTLGQMHFAVRTELGELGRLADPESELRPRIEALEQVVSRADTELRQAIHALSFLGRGNHGLVPSIRGLVRRLREEQRLDIRLKLLGTPAPLPPDQEEALYRLAREALTNVTRHARATYAGVTVTFEAHCVRVEIRDDGAGLLARPAGEQGLHFGLRSMQRRLADVGGGLHVRNRQPHGVTVSGWVPR